MTNDRPRDVALAVILAAVMTVAEWLLNPHTDRGRHRQERRLARLYPDGWRALVPGWRPSRSDGERAA